MNYTFENDDYNKIVIVKVTGDLIIDEAVSMDIKMRTEAKILNYKIIFDFTNSNNMMSFSDVYYWFTKYYENIDNKFKYIPTAHITNEKNEDFFRFIETSWSNIGIIVKMFKSEKMAINWLVNFR
jgi:hypothetical protein